MHLSRRYLGVNYTLLVPDEFELAAGILGSEGSAKICTSASPPLSGGGFSLEAFHI